jgi:hypothetical protein
MPEDTHRPCLNCLRSLSGGRLKWARVVLVFSFPNRPHLDSWRWRCTLLRVVRCSYYGEIWCREFPGHLKHFSQYLRLAGDYAPRHYLLPLPGDSPHLLRRPSLTLCRIASGLDAVLGDLFHPRPLAAATPAAGTPDYHLRTGASPIYASAHCRFFPVDSGRTLYRAAQPSAV